MSWRRLIFPLEIHVLGAAAKTRTPVSAHCDTGGAIPTPEAVCQQGFAWRNHGNRGPTDAEGQHCQCLSGNATTAQETEYAQDNVQLQMSRTVDLPMTHAAAARAVHPFVSPIRIYTQLTGTCDCAKAGIVAFEICDSETK